MRKRYVLLSRLLDTAQIQREAIRLGAAGVREARSSQQVFCTLAEAAVARLASLGIEAREVSGAPYKPLVYRPPTPYVIEGAPVYAGSMSMVLAGVWQGRNTYSPQLTGSTETLAILDTGIRKTHRTLVDKVVYEEDMTGSGNTDDEFDHGTGVAFMAAGGQPVYGQEQGIAPGAHLMNIKVIGPAGTGTVENLVMGIERVIELREGAQAKGLSEDDPMCPNFINISLGTEDRGDPNEPVRVACRAAMKTGMNVLCAAGNDGPAASTIMCPACDPEVLAVGALETPLVEVWERSSRGPTQEGNVKPDAVFWGTNLMVASSRSDDAFEAKSGTSFAAPAATGLIALADEALGRVYGEGMPGYEAQAFFEATAGQLFVKPQGYPAGKDNDVGWGLPFGYLILSAIAQPAGLMEIGKLLAPVMTIAVIGMMSRMVKGTS